MSAVALEPITPPATLVGLRATEATMTIPASDGTAAGVPALHTVFFEFVPEHHIEDEQPPVLLAHHQRHQGWSTRRRRSDVAQGKRDAQYKWPFLHSEWDSRTRSEVLRPPDTTP